MNSDRLAFLLRRWENGETMVSEEDEIIALYQSENGSMDPEKTEYPTLRLFLELRKLGEERMESDSLIITDDEIDTFFDKEMGYLADSSGKISTGFRKSKYRIFVAAAIVALIIGGSLILLTHSHGDKIQNIAAGKEDSKKGSIIFPQQEQLAQVNNREEEVSAISEWKERVIDIPENQNNVTSTGVRKKADKSYEYVNQQIDRIPSPEEVQTLLAYVTSDMKSKFPIDLEDYQEDFIASLPDTDSFGEAFAEQGNDVENIGDIWRNMVDEINADWTIALGDISDFFTSFSDEIDGKEQYEKHDNDKSE